MKHTKAILWLFAVLSLTILIIGCSVSNTDKAKASDAYIIPTDIIVDAAPAPQPDNASGNADIDNVRAEFYERIGLTLQYD